MGVGVEDRVRRLSEVSARSVVEPDDAVRGSFGTGQVLPDELLSVAGLPLAETLTDDQRARLSREEVAAIVEEGVRFEAVLMAGFGLAMSRAADLTDERITYVLHEVGEETRHSRLFVRMLDELGARGTSPFNRGLLGVVKRLIIRSILGRPALFHVLVLAGEEIPDLFQKLSGEHPGTDAFLRQVNRYHRQEEARHLGFARAVLPELWARASWWERLRVRWHAPLIIEVMFDMLVHPGVYEAVGLPPWRTWWAAKRSDARLQLRYQATRPIVQALAAAGAFPSGRLPYLWSRLTGTSSIGGGVGTPA